MDDATSMLLMGNDGDGDGGGGGGGGACTVAEAAQPG